MAGARGSGGHSRSSKAKKGAERGLVDALTTTAALNHVGDLRTETGGRIKPWTTADFNLTYGFKAGPMRGLSLALNVQNLLDDDPPFYDSPLSVGYDPANADPLGRTVTLQLTKTW